MTFDMLLNSLMWAVLVYWVFRFLAIMTNQNLQQRIETLDREIAEIKRQYREVKIEQHGDTIYLFDADTDQFIAQGRTADDFAHSMQQDTTFKIIEGDPEVRDRFKAMFAHKETG